MIHLYQVLNVTGTIQWIGDTGEPPEAEPPCGFDNEKCPEEGPDWKLIGGISMCASVMMVALIFVIR